MNNPARNLILALLMYPLVAQADIKFDTSYVQKGSAAYGRFKDYVDAAVRHPSDPGYGFTATDAAFMYRLTGEKPYCALAVQLVDDQVGAAEAANSARKQPAVADDSYLQAGPMIRDLAFTYDWCAPLATAQQRSRWSAYAEQTVWNIWHNIRAVWGGRLSPWTGWSTSNPANNYYYSFLTATMSWALATSDAEQRATWMALLRDDKIPSLEKYFAALPGGGSEEGTGYGISHRTVFMLYRLWRDNTGEDLANANSHLNDSIYYWIHATLPTLDRVAPIGDQARVSVPVIYDYHRTLMLEARILTRDVRAKSAASWWLNHISVERMTNAFNDRYDLLPAGSDGTPPAQLIYAARGVGRLFARTGWDRGAMWLAFAAGPYNESHAHQDQGSFTLFEGDWLAVTENIWSHSGIQQGTEVNNMLRFVRGGKIVPQRTGTTSTLTITRGNPATGELHATANLTPAYRGANSGVAHWQRTIDFADRSLTVHDTFATDADTHAVFQLNVPGKPTVNGHAIQAGRLHVNVLSPADATIRLVDWSQQDKDYNSGWRIDIEGSGNEFLVELKSSR
ncbi:MAG: hypothetical protein ABI748_00215 [Dokdonella sp.]